ncbi:hypothetical protein DPMN_027209 [Dreissena polymorpha]|uniref:Uncharacterized protein n=1 Tax=Dreissena polymorpha TaxID=45954 RepID=A0A9D4RE69_DREPO|nr:hypothetical protein DPMN_027209 [Dreissena polymorpha]
MAPGYSMTASKDSKEEAKIKPSLPEKFQSSRRVLNSRLEGGDPTKLEKEPLERTSSFEHRRQSSFMLAVTKQKTKDDVIYAVPHNNTKVVNTMKDISQSEMRQMGLRPGNGAGFAGDCVDGMEDPESYNNYTLSNSDHHRRPSLNSPDHSKLPLTPNFSRAGETQRKDSLKKVKGKVGADVIRYPVEGSRRNSQSSESDMSSAAANGDGTVATSNGKPTVPVKPSHFRTRSQSVEDNIAALGEVDIVNNGGSHKVIKPQASNLQTYDGMDSVNRAHTPVQSGLATLPRNKKQGNTNTSGSVDNTVSTSTLMHSQHKPGSQPQPLYQNQPFTHEEPPPPYTPANFSGYQSCLTYQNVVQNDYHSRQGSNSSILSTGTVIECPISDDSHSRQQSTTSQDTLTDKSKPPKAKSKRKEKEEKKKDESGKKSEKKTKSKKEKALKAISEKPPAGHERRDRDEGFSEDRGYIDRKMVESVLNFQKLQRSGSCISQTSNSSLDSERGMRGIVPNDNLSGEIAFDAASIDSHKDSGYASSDRNSSSSTGSITMNPYEQYFLSRNMIPPKTFNQKAMAENMQKLMNKGPVAAGLEYTKEEDLKSLVTNPTEYYHQSYTVGHCQPAHQGHQQQITGQIQGPIQGPPKDVMSLPKSERDQYMFDALISRGKVTPQHGLDQRFPGQPLPSNKLQQQGPHQSTDCGVPNQYNGQGQGHYVGNHGNHVQFRQAEPQLPSPPANESIPGGNDQFISLCHRAEDLMDSCVLEETSLNYVGALASCQQAIDHLIEARKLPHLTQTSHTYAQRKSNACIIKMRTLQKKLSQQEGSSDSGSSDHRTRQHKPQPQMQVPLNGARPPSRTGSQNSMDSISTNSSSGRCNTPVFDKVMRPPTDERVPPVEPHLPPAEYQNAPYKDRSFETNMPDINNAPTSGNADLYGTLPRWKTQKSQEHMRQGNNEKHEAEVYQDFLDSQRRQSGGHSRNNSGARTPVNEIGPSFDPNQFTRTNKAPNLINPGYNYQNYPQQVIPPPVGHPFPVDQPCTYSRMSQGLKPIPVTPPKIENQSKHTEVCNQSVSGPPPLPPRKPLLAPTANVTTNIEQYDQVVNKRLKKNQYHNPAEVLKPSAWRPDSATLCRHESFKQSGTSDTHVQYATLSARSRPVHTAFATKLSGNTASMCDAVSVSSNVNLQNESLFSITSGQPNPSCLKLGRSASFSQASRQSFTMAISAACQTAEKQAGTFKSNLLSCKHYPTVSIGIPGRLIDNYHTH